MQDKTRQGETQGSRNARVSLLDDIFVNIPTLLQAQEVSRKAAAVGFEWDSVEDVWNKVDEEIAELKVAYANAPKDQDGKVEHSDEEAVRTVELELGDILFALVNVARKMGINAEVSLQQTCNKFRNRWKHMEAAAKADGASLEDMDIDQLEQLWQEAKADES